MPLYPRRWIGVGLLAALATGLGALAWGYPFLTSHTAHFSLPVMGEIHVASALFFDIGVFSLVVGATLLILTALGVPPLTARCLPSGENIGKPSKTGV